MRDPATRHELKRAATWFGLAIGIALADPFTAMAKTALERSSERYAEDA